MFITEEHYVTYIHLLLVYYSVFNAIYIVVDLLDYNRMWMINGSARCSVAKAGYIQNGPSGGSTVE